MSVNAEPGAAKEALYCPVTLTGIDPEKTFHITIPPPPPQLAVSDNSTPSTSITTEASQTRREAKEGMADNNKLIN